MALVFEVLCIMALPSKIMEPGASRAMRNAVQVARDVCPRCSRPTPACICSALPSEPLETATRVLVLQHPAEAKRQIASVPLISMCMKSVLVTKGVSFSGDIEPLQQAVQSGFEPLLLFPSADAVALDSVNASTLATGSKKLLVLIDGTWTQARHMVRHSPELLGRCTPIKFDQRIDSIFNALRREPEPYCMSTVEACARALRFLEPSAAAQAAARHMDASLKLLVQGQIANVGRDVRFIDRKRRTGNRLQAQPTSAVLAPLENVPTPVEPAAAVEDEVPTSRPSLGTVHTVEDEVPTSRPSLGSVHTDSPEAVAVLKRLEAFFSTSELAELSPALEEARLTEAEVHRRLGQATFLLNGCADPDERRLVRRSLVEQGAFYLQDGFRVLHSDRELLVVDKPFDTQIAHRTNQRPRWPEEETAIERAAAWLAATARDEQPCTTLQPCHQLDYATSGVLVLAKTDEALSVVSQMFDSGCDAENGHELACEGEAAVTKEYMAVVLGWPDWDSYDFSGQMDVDPTSPFKMRIVGAASLSPSNVVDDSVAERWGPSRLPSAHSWDSRAWRQERSRHTRTRIEVVRRAYYALRGPLAGRPVSLLRLVPSTGRRHQLRVTLAHLGHPIVGDVSYAGDLSTYRLMLHALAITFHLPQGDAPGSVGDGVSGRRARARAKRRKTDEAAGRASIQERVLQSLDGRRLLTAFEQPFSHVLSDDLPPWQVRIR
jgi:23S rRNA-/tRNA-specific pseudouridylate synthase/DTW domain-containing protein YfiP